MRFAKLTTVLLSLFICSANGATWTYDEFKNPNGSTYSLKGPTVVAIGPDLRYYIGGLGRIDALTVTSNYVVTDACTSVGLNEFRTVLGITFDPTHFLKNEIIMFASTSWLAFAGGRSAVPDPTSWDWANGRVDIFRTEVQGNCLARVGSLVTGLPVSNHDHGVNGLAINWDGNLLISNGGMTNAGHSEQGDGDGGYPATPLSGALLEAYYKKQGFEGDVLYTSPHGRETQILNEPDVRIYASGFMNSFSVRVHTNKKIYMVDNGPNPTYGRQSTSCDTHLESDPHYMDKFLWVRRKRWYGHPNRNRGKFLPGEEKQCVFQPFGSTTGGKEPELAGIESSTNGLAEYNSAVQGADFKGSFCFVTIGWDARGSSFSYSLAKNGREAGTREPIFTNNGGLDVVMDRFASLIVTEYVGDKIKVFAPRPSMTFMQSPVAIVTVFPDRGPLRGGNLVTITAKLPNVLQTLSVQFGTVAATDVVYLGEATIECRAPPGVTENELVHVKVIANGLESIPYGNGDYRYMKRSANAAFPQSIRLLRTVQYE